MWRAFVAGGILLLDDAAVDLCKLRGCWGEPDPERQQAPRPTRPEKQAPAVVHTNVSVGASKIYSALNFQGNLIILASLSIFKAFQMIKMLPDNAFHFFLIGLLSNKLLIIDWGLRLACVPATIHLPGEQRERQSWAEGLALFS